jgi:hypothetical protein
VLAAEAGCDLIVVSRTPDAQVEAVEALVRLTEAAPSLAEQLARGDRRNGAGGAAERIRRLKDRFLLPFVEPDPKAARQAAGAGEQRALAEEIAQRSGIPA